MNATDEETLAHDIVARIVDDLSDRRGLRQAWDEIDEEIRDEIILEWIAIVEEKLALL